MSPHRLFRSPTAGAALLRSSRPLLHPGDIGAAWVWPGSRTARCCRVRRATSSPPSPPRSSWAPPRPARSPRARSPSSRSTRTPTGGWWRKSTPRAPPRGSRCWDAQGQVLMQSDGQSPGNPDDQIDLHVPAGTDYLEVENLGGAGAYTLTTTLTPATTPFQPILGPRDRRQPPSWRGTSTATAAPTWPSPTTAPTTCRCCWATATAPSRTRCGTRWGSSRRPRGGGLHRRRPHRPGRRQLRLQRRVGVAGQRRRHLPEPGAVRGGDRASTPSWRGTSTATAAPTWPSPTPATNDVSVLLGNGDGTFQNQVRYAVGTGQSPSWRGTSTATAAPTWPSPTTAPTTCRCCWATATAPSRTRCDTRWGSDARRPRGGGLQRRRPHRPGRRQLGSNDVSVLLGNGDGTFQDQVTYAVGTGANRPRGGGLQRRRPHRPGRRQLRLQRRVGVAGQRRRHLPEPGARTRWGPGQAPSWRGTSTATAAPTWPSPTSAPTTCRCC